MSYYENKIRKTLSPGELLEKVGKIEIKKIFSKLEMKCKSCGSEEIYKKVVPYTFGKRLSGKVWKRMHEEYLIKKYCGLCGDKYE